MTWTIPWLGEPRPWSGMPNSRAVARRAGRPGPPPSGRRSAGCANGSAIEWSAVATVRSGWRTRRPRARSPENACGDGDLVDEVEVDREDRRGARLLGDDVVVPDLLDDRSRLAHDGTALRFGWSPERSRGRAGRRSGGRVGTGSPLVPPVLVLSVRIGAVEGGVQQDPHVRRRGAPDAWLTPGTDRGRAAPPGGVDPIRLIKSIPDRRPGRQRPLRGASRLAVHGPARGHRRRWLPGRSSATSSRSRHRSTSRGRCSPRLLRWPR